MVKEMRPALFATLAGMAAILLIACANVAALVLGQIESRSGELAVRTALGADRSRLATQIVIEVVVIGLAAGVVGSVIAVAGFGMLRSTLPLGAWRGRAAIDWTLLAASIAVATLSSLAIALFPVLALWRQRPARHARRRAHERIPEAARRIAGRDDRRRGCRRGAARVHRRVDRTRASSRLYGVRSGIDVRGVAVHRRRYAVRDGDGAAAAR